MAIIKNERLRKILRGYIGEARWSLITALLSTLCVAGADLLRPWPLKIIIDYVLLDKPSTFFSGHIGDSLQTHKTLSVIVIAASIILISGIKSLAGYLQAFIVSRIGYKLAHALRRELFSHIQRLSITFHKRIKSGELITKVTSDTNGIREIFTDYAMTFFSELLIIIGIFAVMLTLSWKLSLVVLITFPILVFLCFYRYLRIRDSVRRQRNAEGKVTSRINEILQSMSVVQAFGREKYEEKRFENQSMENLEESIRTARLEAAAARAVEIVTASGTAVVVLLGSLQVLNGALTPGDVLVFSSYLTALYGPVRNLAKFSSKFSRTVVCAQRISELLETEPGVKDLPTAIKATTIQGEICFKNVSFDYGDGNNVLNQISLKIPRGEHLALVGNSGAGKSTIAALLLRFFDATSGAIFIDQTDIRNFQRDSLRQKIGIILQESILFSGTIQENIAYGKLDATIEEIQAAAKAANAHEFIMNLPQGYQTVVGERGGTLSGGQRQRIAIARTFIRNTPILILDEPMSGLDVESEGAVKDALKRLMDGRTCILITHDIQSAAEADRILLLENGAIIEQGSHQTLMRYGHRYQKLFSNKTPLKSAVNY
ncbi:MAG: ABC transporter ATP-binding protein [Acidobacteriota bacterium]